MELASFPTFRLEMVRNRNLSEVPVELEEVSSSSDRLKLLLLFLLRNLPNLLQTGHSVLAGSGQCLIAFSSSLFSVLVNRRASPFQLAFLVFLEAGWKCFDCLEDCRPIDWKHRESRMLRMRASDSGLGFEKLPRVPAPHEHVLPLICPDRA